MTTPGRHDGHGTRGAVVAAALGALIAVIGLLVGAHHHLPPGGYALFGTVVGLVLVGVAKVLAAFGVQRPAPVDTPDD